MATVTVPNVELIACGTWEASTGRTTVTPDDLQAAVSAFNDGLIDRPAIKIGHTDPRFAESNHDGSPSFGWVENVRVSDDGKKLLGDLVGVPAKLAEIMPAAYRRRSVEMSWGVRTAAGKVYRAVLTGLALLGATAPAVKNLADVAALYSAGAQIGRSGFIEVVDDTPTVHPAAFSAPDSASGISTTDTGGQVPISEAVRKALGLADDATEEQTTEALKAAGLSVLLPAPADAQATAAQQLAEQLGAPEPLQTAAAAAPTLTQVVDAATFTAMSTRLATAESQLQTLAEAEDKKRRDGILHTALSTGRIQPVVQAQYRQLLDTDETGTTALLSALPASSAVHVSSFGATTAPDAFDTEEVTDEVMSAVLQQYGLVTSKQKGN